MNDCTNEILAALVTATPERKCEVLAVLRGEPAGKRGGRGGGRVEIEPYVGLGAVAEFLGVSRRSVWRWRVPGHRFGTRTRFRLSEVAAYVESEAFRRRLDGLKAGGNER